MNENSFPEHFINNPKSLYIDTTLELRSEEINAMCLQKLNKGARL